MSLLFVAIVLLFVGCQSYLVWESSGRLPRGERLERCKQSQQWRDGRFQNELETPTMTSDEGFFKQLWGFMFRRIDNMKPSVAVPTAKSSLKDLSRNEEVCVWLGHSSVFIQTQGVRFLFDPVLTNQLPVWWFMRPFKGAHVYKPDDIPEIDYLIITHDHWDHLDWRTVRALRNRVSHVVCGLGIGENFEYWGYDSEKVHDLDWGDSLRVNDSLTIRCLPSRHFSGRLLKGGQTLWASYLLDGRRRILVTGDGGYDGRFKRFGEQYPNIDLAIMENGQYDKNWQYIHTLPEQLPAAINELHPRRVLTYHHAKYALAKHAWTAPLDSIYAHAQGQPWQLLTPRIGEPIRLDEEQRFEKWW